MNNGRRGKLGDRRMTWHAGNCMRTLLKHLSHIHGLHPGSSRILIRDHPACNGKILSQCRCEYVANWALIRISTVSIRIDKAATRTSPERPRSEPGLYTDEHVSNWACTRSVYGRARSLLGYPRSVDGVLTKECSKKLLEMKNSKSFFLNTYYICGHFVKAKYTQFIIIIIIIITYYLYRAFPMRPKALTIKIKIKNKL